MDKAILFEIAFALLLGLGSYYCNSEYESSLRLTDSELFRTKALASKKFELKAPLNGKYFTFIFVNTIKN